MQPRKGQLRGYGWKGKNEFWYAVDDHTLLPHIGSVQIVTYDGQESRMTVKDVVANEICNTEVWKVILTK